MKTKYPLIFVVEDNLAYNKVVVHYLKQNGYENVLGFASGEECLQNLYLKPDIIIQDYILQGISGLNVLQRIKKIYPYAEFIFLSSQENIEIAVNTIKFGAFDYIVKNELALHQLIRKIQNIDTLLRLRKKNKTQKKAIVLGLMALLIAVGLAMVKLV